MYNSNGNLDNNSKKNKKKIAICLIVVFIFLALGAFAIKSDLFKKNFSRTIMIYMVGADLESKSKLATVDLDSIDYAKAKENDINVYLVAGGSSKWHNTYINGNETSIYKLGANGFQKIKSHETMNMGDSNVLSSFINFVYKDSKTDKYDLILWNHGGAIYGSEFDEISGDNLTLKEINTALSNTKFNGFNKLETVIFRTCLNGTIEVADTLKDHAKYMVASEEVTLGYSKDAVLSFINTLDKSDKGVDIGIKFVNRYIDFIKGLKSYYSASSEEVYSTYSVVDLSKINRLEKDIDNFFSSVDIESNFKNISKIRADLPQYAFSFVSSGSNSYDTVDLYNLTLALRNISSRKADKLLSSIENAVKYNYASNNLSRGLSIYFPYNASISNREYALKIYDDFENLENYGNFISSFNQYRSSRFNAAIKEIYTAKVESTSEKSSNVVLTLSDNQKDNYSSSTYYVLKENKDGTFLPIFNGNNVEVTDNEIKAEINHKELKAITGDGKNNSVVEYTEKQELKDDNLSLYEIYAKLENDKTDEVTISVTYDNENNYVKMGHAVLKSNNTYIPGNIIVDLSDYQNISFENSNYKMKNSSGVFNDNWEYNGSLTENKYKLNNFELKVTDYDKSSNYYVIFKVTDVYNNIGYSRLVKIK